MARRTSRSKTKPVELFISYSHLNPVWFERLRPMLKFNGCRDKAYVWNDQEMEAGDRWDKEIREALKRMDVFVCLVSVEFLTSEYIKDVELKRALARAKKKEVQIVPIVIYPNVDLKAECPELIAFNPLPDWGKCWRAYESDDGDYGDANGLIRTGLRQAIDKVRARRP